MTMNAHGRVLAVMCASMSRINAESLLTRALASCKLTPDTLRLDHVQLLLAPLTPGLRTFLGDATASSVLGQLRALRTVTVPAPARVDIRDESDIVAARFAAREHCLAHGINSFAQQRVLTVVSELARNIVAYSLGGRIDLTSDETSITVRASDRGPGIANLEEILAGRYRSRTGLGLGILGVKRLATDVRISSGSEGTLVVAKLVVS